MPFALYNDCCPNSWLIETICGVRCVLLFFFCVRRICCAWVNDWDQNRCVVKRARARMTWPPHTNCRIWAMNSVGYYFNLIECAAQNEIKTDQTTGTGSANKRIKIFNWNTRRVSNQTRFGINKKETPIWTCDALQLNIIYFLLNHSKCREYVGCFFVCCDECQVA